MSTEAAVDLVVHRWCDGTNLRSEPFRHGTWYGVDKTTIGRYQNDDPGMRLGGARLVSGTIRAENPHCVDLARSRVLYDAWETLPYGDDMRKIAFAKERSEIRRVLARIAPDADDRARFRGMPSFVLKTMLAERLAAAWCRRNHHDLLIIRVDGVVSEIFDHEGLFRPAVFGDTCETERVGNSGSPG